MAFLDDYGNIANPLGGPGGLQSPAGYQHTEEWKDKKTGKAHRGLSMEMTPEEMLRETERRIENGDMSKVEAKRFLAYYGVVADEKFGGGLSVNKSKTDQLQKEAENAAAGQARTEAARAALGKAPLATDVQRAARERQNSGRTSSSGGFTPAMGGGGGGGGGGGVDMNAPIDLGRPGVGPSVQAGTGSRFAGGGGGGQAFGTSPGVQAGPLFGGDAGSTGGGGTIPQFTSMFDRLPENATLADIQRATVERQEQGLNEQLSMYQGNVDLAVNDPNASALRGNVADLLANPESLDDRTVGAMVGKGNESAALRGDTVADHQRAQAASMGVGRGVGERAAQQTERSIGTTQAALERDTRIKAAIQNSQDRRSAIQVGGNAVGQDINRQTDPVNRAANAIYGTDVNADWALTGAAIGDQQDLGAQQRANSTGGNNSRDRFWFGGKTGAY